MLQSHSPTSAWHLGLLGTAIILTTELHSQEPATAQGRITVREYFSDRPVNRLFWDHNEAYPDFPDRIWYPNQFEWPTGPNGTTETVEESTTEPPLHVRNFWAWEMRGYLHPPLTGDYYFAIASGETSELWLSTDSDFGNLVRIAADTGWHSVREFASENRRTRNPETGRLGNHSSAIPLEAGKAYAILARTTDQTANDNLAVAWNRDGSEFFKDGQSPIPGTYLSSFDRPDFERPFLRSLIGGPNSFTAILRDGFNKAAEASWVDPASIVTSLDGNSVPFQFRKEGEETTLTHNLPEGWFQSDSVHEVSLSLNGQSITQSFSVPTFAIVPASSKLQGYQSTNRGFLMRVLQSTESLANNIDVREQHLAGQIKDNRNAPLRNVADISSFNEKGQAVISDVINFDQDAKPSGVFRQEEVTGRTNVPDKLIPGIPGIEGSTDHITAEILTVVEIPSAGLYNFAFNSDDGFKTTAGFIEDITETVLVGEFNGGRGSQTTYSLVAFPEPGFYKLRSLWYEGGGDADLEWWLADRSGAPLGLLNDGAGGLRTFRDIPTSGAIVTSVYPEDGSESITPEGITVKIEVKNAATSVVEESISVTFNTQAVPAEYSQSDHLVTIQFETGKLDYLTDYEWEIRFSDGITDRSVTGHFRTTDMQFGDLMFIETEDFNYDLGSWDRKNPIGMTGTYPGGNYANLGNGIGESDPEAGTSFGIDYYESDNSNNNPIYRPGTGVETLPAGESNDATLRDTFHVEVNHIVSRNESGDWMNYTRRFPEWRMYFNVYGRLSSGGENIDASLFRVIGDSSKPDQDTELLGHFRPGRATKGWADYEIFPLNDDKGDLAIVQISGITTLRFLTNAGENNNDYLVFVPTVPPDSHSAPPIVPPDPIPPILPLPPIPTAPPSRIHEITNNGDGTVTIIFTGALSASSNAEGPYSRIADATSPHTVEATSETQFFR